MRTHRFEFKKTKRVKVVTHTQAISIDLTKEEAAEVLHRILDGSAPEEDSYGTPEEALDEMIHNLVCKLREFVNDPS